MGRDESGSGSSNDDERRDPDGAAESSSSPPACDSPGSRPPAVRRGIADARQEAAKDLDSGAVATPHDLLVMAGQSAADICNSLAVAGFNGAAT